jgi:putative Mg2+ transporter-C (MgtC) family protein
MRDGVNVRGVNTAATIWCSAAVGVLAGGGYIAESAIGAILVVIAHMALRPLALRVDRMPTTDETEVETVYRFQAVCRSADEAHIRALVVQAITRDELSYVLSGARTWTGEQTWSRLKRSYNASEETTSRSKLRSAVSVSSQA